MSGDERRETEDEALGALLREAFPRPLRPEFRAAVLRALAAESTRERLWRDAGRVAQRWLRVAAVLTMGISLSAVALIARDIERPAGHEPAPAAVAAAPNGQTVPSAEDLLETRGPLDTDTAIQIALSGL